MGVLQRLFFKHKSLTILSPQPVSGVCGSLAYSSFLHVFNILLVVNRIIYDWKCVCINIQTFLVIHHIFAFDVLFFDGWVI